MQLSEFIKDSRKKYKDATIYIVGTGPSLRFFPKNFLKDKICIGLNRAWETFDHPFEYNLTIHPETIPNVYANWYPTFKWITKKKDWLSKPNKQQSKNTIWFNNNKDVKDFSSLNKIFSDRPDDLLYVGRGIHTAASLLVAAMGAQTAVLVGCDLGTTLGQHHVTSQSVRFHGMPPDSVYSEYYYNISILRKYIHQFRPDFSLLSLSPFLGEYYAKEECEALSNMLQIEMLPEPKDVSTYKRPCLDFTKPS